MVEARALFQESLALREKLLKPDDLRLAYAKSNLAGVYLNMGRYSEAAKLMLDAKQIYEQRGAVNWGAMPTDGYRLQVNDAPAWETTMHQSMTVMVTQRDDMVLTVIATADTARAALSARSASSAR